MIIVNENKYVDSIMILYNQIFYVALVYTHLFNKMWDTMTPTINTFA